MIIRDLGEQRPAMVRLRQPQQSILAGTEDGDLGVDVLLLGVREVAGGTGPRRWLSLGIF